MENRKFTPENVSELKENEVFVFGSNKSGNHAGGAARLAVEKFGAVMGQAEGLQGQSYAIPTLDENMEKVDINKIASSVMELYEFAKNNPDKTFYVTKIGCGIAGFSIIEMGDMFKTMLAPQNVILPKEFCITKGYKVFNNDMTCRGFQYKEGETFEMNGKPELCEQGFHFCESPLETRGYYGPINDGKETVMHEVEAIGDTYSDGSKSVTNKIKIGARLDIAGICKAHFEFVRSRCTNENNAEAGKPATAGYKGAATAGDSGAATAGYKGAATAGNYGAATAGDSGAATARGKSSTGDNGLSVARGNNVMVRGGIGAVLVIAEENDLDYDIREWKAAVVDGKKIKADTWYKLVDGEFVEVKEK